MMKKLPVTVLSGFLTEEYGISSFVFRDQRPFHPQRFWRYVQNDWDARIFRSKGLFWLASRPDEALNWSQAGGSMGWMSRFRSSSLSQKSLSSNSFERPTFLTKKRSNASPKRRTKVDFPT